MTIQIKAIEQYFQVVLFVFDNNFILQNEIGDFPLSFGSMFVNLWWMPFVFTTANKSKVYYGIPPEPDLGVVIEEENEDDDDKDKPKVITLTFM